MLGPTMALLVVSMRVFFAGRLLLQCSGRFFVVV
jgi:hypothetical protein